MEMPLPVSRAAERLRIRFNIPPGNKIVLFLGRLHPKKGLDLLLPALARLGGPPATLILAGDGEAAHVAQLREITGCLPLGDKVRWAGFVGGEEKNLLLQGADLFVLPSRHENFGLSVLEALAAGTPVLISDQVALAREVLKAGVGEVVPLEIDALTQALHRALTRRWNRESIRTFVADHYSWERNAATLSELYGSLRPGLISPA